MAQNVTDASENLQFWIPLFAVLPPNPTPGYSAFRSIVPPPQKNNNNNKISNYLTFHGCPTKGPQTGPG